MPRSKYPPEICPASCVGLARFGRRAELVLLLIDGERSVGALTMPRRVLPWQIGDANMPGANFVSGTGSRGRAFQFAVVLHFRNELRSILHSLVAHRAAIPLSEAKIGALADEAVHCYAELTDWLDAADRLQLH
jgi:hypothetical protein